jgi:hypothetical protein
MTDIQRLLADYIQDRSETAFGGIGGALYRSCLLDGDPVGSMMILIWRMM